jgi:hypothetical protein
MTLPLTAVEFLNDGNELEMEVLKC